MSRTIEIGTPIVSVAALILAAVTAIGLWQGHEADHAAEVAKQAIEAKAAAVAAVTHEEAHKAQEGELGKLRDSIERFAGDAAEKFHKHGEEK